MSKAKSLGTERRKVTQAIRVVGKSSSVLKNVSKLEAGRKLLVGA